MRRAGVIVVALATVGGILAGCESVGPENRVVKSPTVSASPTAGSVAPPMPEIATEKSKLGARAFAIYYYQLVEYGRASGDWYPLKQLSDPGCGACKSFWEKTPRFPGDQPLKVEANDTTIRLRLDGTASYGISVSVLQTYSTPSPGADPVRHPEQVWSDKVNMTYSKAGWIVSKIETLRIR